MADPTMQEFMDLENGACMTVGPTHCHIDGLMHETRNFSASAME